MSVSDSYPSVRRLARALLTPLLEHIDPAVREQAVRDIAKHMDAETREILGRVSILDPSPAVRTAAEAALEPSV